MHLMRAGLAFFFFFSVCFAEASQIEIGTMGEKLALFPQCAQECMMAQFDRSVCSPYDGQCVCTSTAFRNGVADCVINTCTMNEILTTQKTTVEVCGSKKQDKSKDCIVVTILMSVMAALFVILRFVYKTWIAGLPLELDDWFVLASLLAAVPNCIITVQGSMANGLGKDIFNLTAAEITQFARYLYIMVILYYAETTLLKLTFICFYMRPFPSPAVQRVLWATFIVTVIVGLGFVLTAVLQCQPVGYFWTRWEGAAGGKCISPHAISFSNAAVGILLDLWILAVPLAQLPKLQLYWKKKLGVGLMFCVGTFVTVVSMIRLKSLVDFQKTKNSTLAFASVNIWSTVEVCVGIMCACLPTLRLLLVRSFPVLAGSTVRSQWSTGSYPRRPPAAPDIASRQKHHSRGTYEVTINADHKKNPLPAMYEDDSSGILEMPIVSADKAGSDAIPLPRVGKQLREPRGKGSPAGYYSF